MLIPFLVTCSIPNTRFLSLYVYVFYMFFTLLPFSETQTDESDVEPEPSEVPSQLEQDHEAARNEIQILKEQLKITQLEVSKKEAEMRAFKEAAAATKESSDAKIQELETNLSISRFGLERFSKDNALVKFYTGFPTYDHFKLFFELVKPTAETMVYVYASGIGTNRPGVRKMQLIDELFLFCVRLKLGLFELDLAQRFELYVASISRKITTWANFLYFFLGNQPIWPTRECINEYMPDSFKKLYPSTRVILDCTEIYVQTPSSLLLQSQLYSSYKSNTTLKGLIGIAPHGAITFVSSLYTGSISDKEITRSGILDLLEAHDSVMADKGFDIADLLMSKQVSLNLPPFLRGQTQFSAQEVLKTKNIAKVRIHVERAIRRIKEFHLFDSDISLSTLGSVNQLYTVACLLTNFQGALIKDTGNSDTSDN